MTMYLLPVIGLVPSAWTLLRRNSTREQRQVSRVAVTLALAWLCAYSVLWVGAGASASSLSLRLLYLNGLLSTGYFLSFLIFAIRLLQGHLPRLPHPSRSQRDRPPT
ncbi:hypothetical protein [Rubidibacter lacunae]|uniref:hypothetical protein n=1 Tax=Rubidibacter lacunae TaxID=582514 RepID=UPI001E604EF0|nr:hypothetical protein [Rubidibacter lacunae]